MRTKHGGEVVSRAVWERLQKAVALEVEISRRNQAEEKERKSLTLTHDYVAGSEFLATHEHGYQLSGELARAIYAFCRHESGPGTDHRTWCGSWHGGTFFIRNGIFYGWRNETTDYNSTPEKLAANLAAYARNAYAVWARRNDRHGMRVAADLLIAAANLEDIKVY